MGKARVAVGRAIAGLSLLFAADALAAANACSPSHSVLPVIADPSPAVVSVYWDISGSMSFSESVTKEIVATLDSAILQLAGIRTIQHHTIGDEIRDIGSARDVRVDTKQNTALHKAAEQIGSQLAASKVAAAIIVSDLDLDIPDRDIKRAEACPGVPMPANQKAGAIFGRCLMAGLGGNAGTRLPDLIIDAFTIQPHAAPPQGRKRATATRPHRFFVLVIARDVTVARSVTTVMRERWSPLGAHELMLADSHRSTDALSKPVACTWGEKSLYDVVRSHSAGTQEQCYFLCTDTDGRARLTFTVPQLSGESTFLKLLPAGVSAHDAKASLNGSQLTVDLQCPSKPRLKYTDVTVTLHYEWQINRRTELPSEGNVQDLFAGLMTILPQIVQPRSVVLGIKQR